MPRFGESVASACKARWLQHREVAEEARNIVRDQLDAIERAAAPATLSDEDAQRPLMVPLGHCAIDIWQLIIDEVTEAQIIFKLWEVCPFFRDILRVDRKYVQARLPQIIKLILDKRPCYLQDDEGTLRDRFFSRIFCQFNATALKLRMLSRICKKSVDGLLELEAPSVKLPLYLKDAHQVRVFLDNIFKGCFMPDFTLLRCVAINEVRVPEKEKQVFHEIIAALLGHVGKHITSLWHICSGPPQVVYDKLKGIVRHLPNLESLTLSFPLFHLENDGAALPRLEDLQPFPACPKLRSLSLSSRYLPPVYLRRIMRDLPSLNSLEVEPYFLREELRELLYPSEMNANVPHLEYLRTPMYWALLRPLELKLPLKCVIFEDHEQGRRFTTLDVFTFLNQFKDTLEHLELLVDVWHEGNCFLELPNLKVFKWQCNLSFRDMRFLLHAGHLEEMRIEFYQRNLSNNLADWFESDVKIGFDGFTMWEVFPRLKKVQVRFQWLSGTPSITCKRNGPVSFPTALVGPI